MHARGGGRGEAEAEAKAEAEEEEEGGGKAGRTLQLKAEPSTRLKKNQSSEYLNRSR